MTRAAPVAGTRPTVRKGRIGTMRVAVDGEERPGSPRAGVSGSVVHALVSLIRSESGEAGVAQTLALAAEDRSFPVLGDADSWTPLADATALFTAGALVTGDGAIALHTGHELLWIGEDGALADRLAALGSPEAAVRHIGALIEQFEGATEAVALESGPGHALVQVTPVGGARHAHLCELTRGLLSELPVPFDREPARVTEHECAARGGRHCRYALTWDSGAVTEDSHAEDTQAEVNQSEDTQAEVNQSEDTRAEVNHEVHRDSDGRLLADAGSTAAARRPATPGPTGNGHVPTTDHDDRNGHLLDERMARLDHGDAGPSAPDPTGGNGPAGEAESDLLVEQLQAVRTALVEASAEAARWEAVATSGGVADERLRERVEAEAARTRTEISRLERLLEGASTPTLDLLEHDSEAVVAELGERADHVLESERYVLMIRVGAGMPLELHHRGLTAAEARGLTAELWAASPDDAGAGLQVVDIASPVRRYGRLAVFVRPRDGRPRGRRAGAAPVRPLRSQRPRRVHAPERRQTERLDGPHPAVVQRAAVRTHQPGPGPPDPGRHRPDRDRVRPVHRLPVGPRPVPAGARRLHRRHDRPRRRPRTHLPPLVRRGGDDRSTWARSRQGPRPTPTPSRSRSTTR